MKRDALVVGINAYERLAKLHSPSEDAEAIAQCLNQYGDFRVWRVPEAIKGENIEVSRHKQVSLPQLEKAIAQLFNPPGENFPDTALLFFSGHGLRKDVGGIREGFLATSEVNPEVGIYGLSLEWLRKLLRDSPVRQQVVWLDCCYSGELLHFDDADPGDRGSGKDKCFVAASRDYEAAYEEINSNHGVLTNILLEALMPESRADGQVTNFTIIDYIEGSHSLKTATQRPLFSNSGQKIILTGRLANSPQNALAGVCPYQGKRKKTIEKLC
ncbi:MAG: caspase family protein [Elainellaceae cyanobacterium]